MQTSPRCLAQLQPNFWWWSGSLSGTFITGTGPIGQGMGKKKAENLNFLNFLKHPFHALKPPGNPLAAPEDHLGPSSDHLAPPNCMGYQMPAIQCQKTSQNNLIFYAQNTQNLNFLPFSRPYLDQLARFWR